MTTHDDSSSSDCSSIGSIKDHVPATRHMPHRTLSMPSQPLSGKANLAEVSDSSSDNEINEDLPTKSAKTPPSNRKAPARAVTMPISSTKHSDAVDGVHIHETTLLMSKLAADMAAELKRTLDAASMHSRDSEIEPDFTAECQAFKTIKLRSIVLKKTKKKSKKDAGLGIHDLDKMSIVAKKEERMERVRRRLETEQAKKEQQQYEAKLKELTARIVDTSENGRRRRCWEWYSRTGMVSKAMFLEKLPHLPPTAGLEEADVELLPWNLRGTMVNIAKMNSFLLNPER